MQPSELKELVTEIVREAAALKDKHTDEVLAPVNYACIFSQSEAEHQELVHAAMQLGDVLEQTHSGPLFKISPLPTIAGNLRLLKIRNPDRTRPERGDADFTVKDYPQFKDTCLARDRFKLIPRKSFEMIELIDDQFNVRVYFSNPPLDQQFNLA